ncbi:MAG: response regulator, partial [Gemmatimonadetes bacterium]|nr:response regulator [Gemmatimonadota bacterium]
MNPSDPGEAGAYGPARILVVDDDRDLVEILRLLLEREGHHVISAYNAVDGLALAEAARPDLLILDVLLPAGT